MTRPDLTASIASRICHDLVSPIGAIVNGVDLIREIGGGNVDDELGMISQSAERASGLLQFYRIAFGAADPDAAAIARTTLSDLADRLIATQRVILDWAHLDGPPLSRAEARLLYQMMLCAKLIVAMRGVVQISLAPSQTVPITIKIATGDGAQISADLVKNFHLADGADVPPRLIEFPLSVLSAKEIGLDLDVQTYGSELTMTAS